MAKKTRSRSKRNTGRVNGAGVVLGAGWSRKISRLLLSTGSSVVGTGKRKQALLI